MGGLVNTSFKKPLIPRLWEAVPDRSTSIRITDWVKMVLALSLIHIFSPGSLLVEVGGHGNTLQEAIAGARLFAQSIGQVLKTMEEP